MGCAEILFTVFMSTSPQSYDHLELHITEVPRNCIGVVRGQLQTRYYAPYAIEIDGELCRVKAKRNNLEE